MRRARSPHGVGVTVLVALMLVGQEAWAQQEPAVPGPAPASAPIGDGAAPQSAPAAATSQPRRAPAVPRRAPAESIPRGACVPSCGVGFYCVAGRCRSACNPPCAASAECVAGHCLSRVRLVDRHLEDEKSAGCAFALELVLGFGIGNYYAGSSGWGAVGTLGSILGITALVIMYEGDGGGGLIAVPLALVALPLRIGAVIAAPLVAARHNRELRRRARMAAAAAGTTARPRPPWGPPQQRHPSMRNVAMASVPLLTW